MKNAIRQALKTIKEDFNDDNVFVNARQFRAVLNDVRIESDEKKVRYLLNVAIRDMQVYSRLKTDLNSNVFIIDNLTAEMSSDYMLGKDIAKIVIECFAELLGHIPVLPQENLAHESIRESSYESYALALKLIYGEDGAERNDAKSVDLMKHAASKGNDDAKEFIDVYHEILLKAKNISSEAKRPFSPMDFPFWQFKDDADIEIATYSAVFGASDDYSVPRLATWLIITSIFQYLYHEAISDEQNLFMVKELIDTGIDTSEESYQTDLDRLYQLLRNQSAEHIAIKNYEKYKALAPFYGLEIMMEAQDIFGFIGKPDNLFANIPNDKKEEAVKNYAMALCVDFGMEFGAGTDEECLAILFERFPQIVKEKALQNERVTLDDFKKAAIGNSAATATVDAAMEFYSYDGFSETENQNYEEESDMSEQNGIDRLIREANQGSVEAQRDVAIHYQNEHGNATEAFKWFKKAAENGDITSQYYVGEFYLKGHGTSQNIPEGLSWFKKAANQGVKEASELLASAYFKGSAASNIPRDVDEGIKWHKHAAELGSVSSAVTLGGLYSEGDRSIGIRQNGDEAVKYYKIAADQSGDVGLLQVVGNCYLGAFGCTQNMAEAKKYLELAANKGSKDAKKTLKKYFR